MEEEEEIENITKFVFKETAKLIFGCMYRTAKRMPNDSITLTANDIKEIAKNLYKVEVDENAE